MKIQSHNELFNKFEYADLTDVNPRNISKKAGVYIIKVKEKGIEINQILRNTEKIIKDLNWDFLGDYISKRLKHLEKINKIRSNIIYIGSSSNLKSRFEQLRRSHTAMYSIWLLLYFDWKLQIAFKEAKKYKKLEKELVNLFANIWGDKPALNIK